VHLLWSDLKFELQLQGAPSRTPGMVIFYYTIEIFGKISDKNLNDADPPRSEQSKYKIAKFVAYLLGRMGKWPNQKKKKTEL